MTREKKRQGSKKFDQLQTYIEEEITLCQEILSQMSQQEYLMLIGELEMRDQLEKEIQILVEKLKSFQRMRSQLINELISCTPSTKTLVDLLDPIYETDTEILILLEKSKLLTEKINKQKKLNRTLYQMIQKERTSNLTNHTLRSQIIDDKKSQKPILLTIDYPKEKSP